MARTINTEELVSLLDSAKEIAVLDVLPAEQYEAEQIPGSKSAPIDSPDFMKLVEAQTGGDSNKLVVLYCAGTPCDASSRAASTLRDAGYSEVWEYSGGMADDSTCPAATRDPVRIAATSFLEHPAPAGTLGSRE